jgi:hypothetical protein
MADKLTPLEEFAELISQDLTIPEICTRMRIGPNHGQRLLRLLRKTMGPQAK